MRRRKRQAEKKAREKRHIKAAKSAKKKK